MTKEARPARAEPRTDPDRALAVYLRDHFAGSAAGLALVRRFRREHEGRAFDAVVAGVEVEIADDRRALEAMMSLLGVTPSAIKSALGSVAEVVGRLKSNGRIVRRSPITPVVELEGLAAGIITKRNLWRTLREAAPRHDALDVAELDRLIEGATSQFERIMEAHRRAAREAFAAMRTAAGGPAPE